jgi:hypothetical protein
MEATGSSEASSETATRGALERVAARWPWLVIGFLLFPLAVAYGLKVHAPADDAYIYLVYVRNLVEGRGLTFQLSRQSAAAAP